jgi:hypothetical protein
MAVRFLLFCRDTLIEGSLISHCKMCWRGVVMLMAWKCEIGCRILWTMPLMTLLYDNLTAHHDRFIAFTLSILSKNLRCLTLHTWRTGIALKLFNCVSESWDKLILNYSVELLWWVLGDFHRGWNPILILDWRHDAPLLRWLFRLIAFLIVVTLRNQMMVFLKSALNWFTLYPTLQRLRSIILVSYQVWLTLLERVSLPEFWWHASLFLVSWHLYLESTIKRCLP